MPLAKFIRHSPLYLYVKLYSLSLLVTVFASAPVSKRLVRLDHHLQRINSIRSAAEGAYKRGNNSTDISNRRSGNETSNSSNSDSKVIPPPASSSSSGVSTSPLKSLQSHSHHQIIDPPATASTHISTSSSIPFPYAIKTLSLDADTKFPAFSHTPSARQRVTRAFQRWGRRFRDLDAVKEAVQADQIDTQRSPELLLPAKVRCSKLANEKETAFLRARSQHIIDSKVLHEVLLLQQSDSCYEEANVIRPEDVPTLAIGGSGGGYRASFGFMASLHALQTNRWLEATHWLAGVSGSCWTLAALYTVGNLDAGKLIRHYQSVAQEGCHPLSRRALDIVARSNRGVYFLLAPLLSKLRSGIVGIGVMDMYATLTTTYQLLSRSPHARPRLSRSTFQFSQMWRRWRIGEGAAPMPILTAVRVKHRERAVTKEEDQVVDHHHRSTKSDPKLSLQLQGERTGQDGANLSTPLKQNNLDREEDATQARRRAFPQYQGIIKYQWWEMNPLEVGSCEEQIWIPAWSYGRAFRSGQSVTVAPEISLSLLLGQVTSAPAGPLTGYISTMLATLRQGTIMSYLLSMLNKFVQHKRWEKRWGNPIRGADEPNPLFGQGSRGEEEQVFDGSSRSSRDLQWESKKRIKLMDSGLSNNLPNHVFTTSARRADIIVSFDQSSDVQTGAALSRLDMFAMERRIVLIPEREIKELPPHPVVVDDDDDDIVDGAKGKKENAIRKRLSSSEVHDRFKDHYAQVFQGWYLDDLPKSEGKEQQQQLSKAGLHGAREKDKFGSRRPDLHLIYCPLLPHGSQPDYDPVTATFSTSYNLVWSAEEIETIAKTARGNAIDYVIPTLVDVYRGVYFTKQQDSHQK